MGDKLEKLVEHRDAILLAEIGALIHDLGKLSEEFVRSKCVEESGKWVHHTAVLEYDANRNIHYARKVKQILESIEIKLDGNNVIRLYDFVLGHHKKKWNKNENWDKPEYFELEYPKYNENNLFLKFITASDTFDSEEDKSHSKDPQSVCGIYKSTSFGFENELIEMGELIEERKNIYKTIINWLDTCDFKEIVHKRRECMGEIRKSFSKALGETRRSANDVTLWDHSYMTASIMKALIAYRILDPSFVVSSKEEIKEKRPFKIFAVVWDFFGFIKQSHKIPDVVGRIEVISEIKKEIKHMIEEEYVLGNSIYDDDFGIYFLIPSALDDNDLEEVKKEIFNIFNDKTNGILLPVFHIEKPKTNDEFRIGKLLTEAMKNVKEKISSHQIELITTPTWVENWKNGDVELSEDKLVCNVCGKGYFCEVDDEKICKTCKSLRNKGRKSEIPQTIFIDEIAWNPEEKRYENICLLIAKFDLGKWLNGNFVQSLFIRNSEKHYDDLGWSCGKTISGLAKLLGGTLRDKIGSNVWDKEAEKNVYDAVRLFLLNRVSILKGKSIESIACDVIKLIKKEIKKGKTLSDILNREKREYFISNIIFNFEYLDTNHSQKMLKPSSSSRLMRIWNNTKEFFKSIEKEICLKVPLIEEVILKIKDFKFENTIKNKLTKNRAYLIEIKDLGLQGEVICEANCDNPKELTVITPHLSAVLKKEKDKVKDKEITIKDVDTKKKIATARILEIEKSKNVRAFRVISISPTLFMAIIPAKESVEIVKIIHEEYEKHFGKVFGKLPLHVGLIYFKRKMPVFTVLDSASRMLSEFEKLSSDEVKLRVVSKHKADDNVTLTLTHDSESEQSPIKYEIKIPYKLGDGNIDYYHPYLIVEDTSEDVVEIKLDDEIITQKHVSKIKKGDKIVAKKYLFDFEFLDSNIRRFDIGEKRKHWLFTASPNKPKPYLLWDIDNFERLRKLIQKLELTTTQIMNLYEMLIGRIEDWELKRVDDLKNDTFEKLVENAIKSAPLRLKVVDGESGKGKISKQDFEFFKATMLNGMFFDFVDLWHTILKKKFEEGEENE